MAEQSREPEILKSIIDDTEYNKTPQSRNEEILLSILNNTEYTKTPQSREEELLLALKEKIEGGGGASPVLIDKNITENGTYNAADDGADGYKKIVVDVVGKPALVPWSTGTDDEIVAMVNGYYDGKLTIDEIKSVWSLGDCRSINLSAMEAVYVSESHRAQTVEMMIIDFEHDDLTTAIGEKTKALITVNLKDCLRANGISDTGGSSNSENGVVNASVTNLGGWKDCDRRKWCNNIFYNSLPQYIKAITKAVNKKTSAGKGSTMINVDSDYCFLLAEIEIFGSITGSIAGEGEIYSLFRNDVSKINKLPRWNSSSVSTSWWERSPSDNNTSFCLVNRTGTAYAYSPTFASGISPSFCI